MYMSQLNPLWKLSGERAVLWSAQPEGQKPTFWKIKVPVHFQDICVQMDCHRATRGWFKEHTWAALPEGFGAPVLWPIPSSATESLHPKTRACWTHPLQRTLVDSGPYQGPSSSLPPTLLFSLQSFPHSLSPASLSFSFLPLSPPSFHPIFLAFLAGKRILKFETNRENTGRTQLWSLCATSSTRESMQEICDCRQCY